MQRNYNVNGKLTPPPHLAITDEIESFIKLEEKYKIQLIKV
jgi:hypothetical protein